VGKARSLPLNLAIIRGFIVVGSDQTRKHYTSHIKFLISANTLAYLGAASVTKKKKFYNCFPEGSKVEPFLRFKESSAFLKKNLAPFA
jgi:hypothetical protein